MSALQTHRSVSLETPLGEDVLLVKRLEGREALGRSFQYELDLISKYPNLPFDEIIGQSVILLLKRQHAETRYFHGYISRFKQVNAEEDQTDYQATMVPWLWFLTQTSDFRIFQEKTIPEIIESIFKTHGFDKYELRFSSNYAPQPYCVQYAETDFNFVNRLMEAEGIYYYLIHNETDSILVLTDSSVSHEPVSGYEEILYRPSSDPHAEEETIDAWSLQKQLLSTSFAHTDFDFANPRKNLLTQSQIPREHAISDLEHYHYPGNYKTHEEGEIYAKIRIEEIQARHELFEGKSCSRGLSIGHTFALGRAYREDQNQAYLVTAIHHTIISDAFRAQTSTDFEPVYRCTFTALRADVPFRPERITPKPTLRGLQTAIVVGPKNEEVYTDKFGRIKVQFHWDRDGQFNEDSSCWIRISQYWVGKAWGALHLPRVGQEVMVAFINGDPDCPIITGQLYNAECMPPYTLPNDKDHSGLKSRSLKGGSPENFSEIRFEDKNGEEQLVIHSGKDLEITIENDRREKVGHDETRSVANDRTHQIDHDETLNVGNNRKIKVTGTHTETIQKDTQITIKDGSYTHDVAKNKAKYHVKEDIEEDYDAKQTTKVAKEIAITSEQASIHITAKTEIQLSVGSSKLLMKSDGSIELSGNNIAIKGLEAVYVKGGSVTTQADNDNNVKGNNVLSEGAVTNTLTGGMVLLNP